MKNEILKRLEIIKSAIGIEEIELIDFQICKLEQVCVEKDVSSIIQLIKNRDFKNVIEKIDEYKASNSGLTHFETPQIQGLKLELRVLENRLSELLNEKIEFEQQIYIFNQQYMLRLGPLIGQILKLQEELAGENSNNRGAFRKEYEDFQKNYQEEQLKEPVNKLDEAQKRELKKAYRKASHICHPDKLTGEHKVRGEEIFAALTEAYKNQDLKKVLEILAKLETGEHLDVESEIENDMEKLLKQVRYLKSKIENIEKEIEAIKQNDAFKKILEIRDVDEYLAYLEKELKARLENLQSSKKK